MFLAGLGALIPGPHSTTPQRGGPPWLAPLSLDVTGPVTVKPGDILKTEMYAGIATSSRRLCGALALAAAICAPVAAAAQDGVRDLGGQPAHPLTGTAGTAATVLIFTAVDCPISDRYAPELQRLRDAYARRGVRFWLVYPNAGDAPAAVRAHAEVFSYAMPVVLDPRGALVGAAKVSVTPEAAVFDATGRLMYHGRIDDRYLDFGLDRPVPTRRDLAEALGSVIAGRRVQVSETRAVGCAIVRDQP